VIVTTEQLARSYRKLNQNVYVCPNQIDPPDWPDPPEDDDVLRVGWFAGRSHRPDGPLVAPALAWAAKQDGVEVWMMGVGAERTIVIGDDGATERVDGEGWPEFHGVRFRHLPPTNDIASYRHHMAKLDIGLAPVKRSISNDARSDLKAIEYCAAGALPVLSDVPAYENWVDGEHCRKASTRKGFRRVLQDLIQNPDETKRLAREARSYVLKERTVERNIDKWREAVTG
jgi:glycosyltransferase involved in cell wall biosynthesis